MIRINRRGFTLVEIMIVVAIIALLAAVAIPNLLRARLNANESAAIGDTHALISALESYRAANGLFPTALGNLSDATPSYINSTLTGGSGANGATNYHGYAFTYAQTNSQNSYTLNMRPVTFQTTGERSFFTDTSGVIRFTSANAAATGTDTPLK